MSQSRQLRINHSPIAGPRSLYENVVQHREMIASAQALIARGSTATQVAAEEPTAYIFQKEFAVVPRDQPCILGSDRATTCHIMIVLSASKAFCAHLDGADGQTKALLAMLRETFAGESSLDVHLAGGFLDDRGLSVELGRELLTALDRGWPGMVFNLKTACLGPLNTIAGPAPVIRALAFDTRTSALIANGWFANRGENLEWRAARSSYGTKPLVNRLDMDDLLEIPDRRYLEEMLKITDDRTLLQMSSTSPEVEHDTFCEETRATLRYLLNLSGRERL